MEKHPRSCYNRDLIEAALIPAHESQDVSFAAAFSVVCQAIADRVFPAATLAVTQAGRLVALKAFGTSVYGEDPAGFHVAPETVFDLASLTKPIATTTMAMILYERGQLKLDTEVAGIVPEILGVQVADPRRREITFRMLLAHSSGLPAYEKLFLRTNSREELLQAAFTNPLSAAPGTRAEYSDIGFIILGIALERIAEESLDCFSQREIFGPLAMSHTNFNPSLERRCEIPPTADETAISPPGETKPRSTFRNRIIQGEVQDENAAVLGGVAGHAGLFSSAADVAKFAHVLLQCGAGVTPDKVRPGSAYGGAEENSLSIAQPRFIRPETIALFTRRETSPFGTSRTLGWDTPSAPSQSGQYFGPNSYGHLGYTGTSLWIDPDRQLSVTLLTNRTWPDCSNHAIKQIRPKIHDAVLAGLGLRC